MIQKPLTDIQLVDIESLVTNQVREMKTLDFKRDLPGPSDTEKVRFLANVSSFANTNGGDLIFGVEESEVSRSQFKGSTATMLKRRFCG